MAGTTERLAAITARHTFLAGIPTRRCILAGMAGGTRDSMAESSLLAVCSVRTDSYMAKYPTSVAAKSHMADHPASTPAKYCVADYPASTPAKYCMADYPTPVFKCSRSTARYYMAELSSTTAPATCRWLRQLPLGWPLVTVGG